MSEMTDIDERTCLLWYRSSYWSKKVKV